MPLGLSGVDRIGTRFRNINVVKTHADPGNTLRYVLYNLKVVFAGTLTHITVRTAAGTIYFTQDYSDMNMQGRNRIFIPGPIFVDTSESVQVLVSGPTSYETEYFLTTQPAN